ncbi:MAG TPA: AAA family ATPase [Pyrinomonadaceae bacterium]|nr:AAA family ATPase [Pyrinomonadaceae bacterium]
MEQNTRIVFGPFSLDLINECLWRDAQIIKLRPKAFAVLKYLISRPGQLVTKLQLLNAAWPEIFVGEAVLKVTVRQLREALGDDPKAPRFIETAHRRGYRFICPITEGVGVLPEIESVVVRERTSLSWAPESSTSRVVGRDDVLGHLQTWLEKMLSGERQTVFITGEAGIGKTVLVDTFLRSIAFDRSIRIGRGQCLEQYGPGEAYLPILQAVGRLCREHGRQVVDVLRAYAPMWLLQMPSLMSAADRELLSQEVFGATRERMLREIGDALEVLTSDLPLVLIVEDLQWSDYSTLDLISYLARQRHTAQLMLIGTYRTVELIVTGHPLQAVKRELLAKQQCEELPLEYLNEEAIDQYLSVRFANNRFPKDLAALIQDRTYGNPLFMVNAVDYLVADGFIGESEGSWALVGEIENIDVSVPDSIKQMIEKQLDLLDANQLRTLEAASVAGAEFSALALVVALGEDSTEIEARCDELIRRGHFIRDCGVHVLPNGEAVSRYGFIHDLYQKVLYERISESRRMQLHRRIGDEGENVYGERATEIAAELAMHFERGSDYPNAIKYLREAADNDIRRFAYKEAVALSRRGLHLLEKLPDTPERAEQELGLLLTLGLPLVATEGYAAPDVGSLYLKAWELCQQLGETPAISDALWGLRTFYTVRAELKTAREIADQFLHLAKRLTYPGLELRGHWAIGITSLHMGQFAAAMSHFDKALLLYEPERLVNDAVPYAQNPGVAVRCFSAWGLWFLGQPKRALNRITEAIALGRALSEPHGLAPALVFAAILHQLCRNPRVAQEYAAEAIAVSSEHGLVLYQSIAKITHAWSLLDQEPTDEAIDQMRQGLAAYHATGAEILRPHFLAVLGHALGRKGQFEEGLQLVEEALRGAYRTGERSCESELYRLKGEILLMQTKAEGISPTGSAAHLPTDNSFRVAKAEGCFEEAIRIAKRQGSRSWEQRAVISLAQLYDDHGNQGKSRAMLSQICSEWTERSDTESQEAQPVFDEVSGLGLEKHQFRTEVKGA